MLSSVSRLKKKKDFERVFKKGEGFKEDFLYLKFLKNNLKNSRFGVIVSKKFSLKATARNKIKRKIREIIKIKLPQIKKEVDAAIVVLPGLGEKDFWEMEEIITKLFGKAGILKT